jgi:RHS repeat-associated protein
VPGSAAPPADLSPAALVNSGGPASATNSASALISQRRGGSTYYYHGDELGVRELTDSDEDVTDTYAYDAWGDLLSSTGSTTNPFLYRGTYGYYKDAESEFALLTHRYYAAGIARFVTVDPVAHGPNWLRYVSSSPVRETDPYGLFEWVIRTWLEVDALKRCKERGQWTLVGWAPCWGGGGPVGNVAITAHSKELCCRWRRRVVIVVNAQLWEEGIRITLPERQAGPPTEPVAPLFSWDCFKRKKGPVKEFGTWYEQLERQQFEPAGGVDPESFAANKALCQAVGPPPDVLPGPGEEIPYCPN